jgi:hypothetical protein
LAAWMVTAVGMVSHLIGGSRVRTGSVD